MKKLYLFVCLSTVAFSLCFLTSCGGISVKGANGETFESYQECCSANDYEAAHLYLTKMKNAIGDDWDKEREYKEARSYVFKKETLFLMSQESEDAQKRIIYLLKEQQGGQTDQQEYNNNIAMLIDLAIENGEVDYVKTLASQYKFDNFQHFNIKDENILSTLASLNNEELSDFVINIISSQKIPGIPSSIGLHKDYISSGYGKERHKDHWKYVEGLKEYHKICNKILDVAIGSGNNYLAQKILLCYKQNIEALDGGYNMVDRVHVAYKAPDGTSVDVNQSYVWYTDEDKIAAQKKYDEAVRSGAFNNE